MIPYYRKLLNNGKSLQFTSVRTYPRGSDETPRRVPVYDHERDDIIPDYKGSDDPEMDKHAFSDVKDGNLISPVAEPIPKEDKIPVVTCMRKQFNFYYGDRLPKNHAIPMASRGWQSRLSSGDYFTIHPYGSLVNDEDEADGDISSQLSFADLDVNEIVIRNLREEGIISPTKIQALGISPIMEGTNVMLTAETGCGKTLCFLIPVIEQILRWKPQVEDRINKPLAIIITPSIELAHQIGILAKKLTKNLDLNTVIIKGGNKKSMLRNPPVANVDLIVGTLGIVNNLVGLGIYNIDNVRHIVLDEADTLFDVTFLELLRKFLQRIQFNNTGKGTHKYPEKSQLTLNSATMPENVPSTLNEVVKFDCFKEIATKTHHYVKSPQKFLRLIPSLKPMTLLKYVKKKTKSCPIIIFSNTNATCDFISIFLRKFNVRCVNLNGQMPVDFRKKQFLQFQSGLYSLLSTTDAGCRGLDTKSVRDVINYDFPLISAEYVHRCGRVGRIGSPKDSKIINFVSRPLEIILTKKIEFAARKLKPVPMVDLIHCDRETFDEFEGQLPPQNYVEDDDTEDCADGEGADKYSHAMPT